MAVAALKKKPKLKTFHAAVHVTRVEEWCVEAETAEEARALLLSGAAIATIGDCLHAEVEAHRGMIAPVVMDGRGGETARGFDRAYLA